MSFQWDMYVLRVVTANVTWVQTNMLSLDKYYPYLTPMRFFFCDNRPCPERFPLFIGMKSLDGRCSLTLDVHRKHKLSHNYLSRDCPTCLPVFCMSCFLYCIPVCCRQQTHSHPYTEDPEREDNFIEADARPPIVICLSDLYSRFLVSWSDYWEGE